MTKPAALKVKQIPVSELHNAPWNANRVPDDVLEKVRRSIADFGVVENLVARERPDGGYEVISGNHRLGIYREMGLDKAPVHVVDVDDAHARILAQTLNRTRGQDDAEAYAALLTDVLAEMDMDEVLAYLPESERTITQALDAVNAPADDGVDEVPDLPDEPDSNPGEVYELGPHRLVCGDANDPAVMFMLMQDDRAELVVTSPPYNQKLDTFSQSGMHKDNSWVDRMQGAYSDSLDEGDYQAQQVALLDALMDVTTDSASIFYNHKHRYRDKVVVSPMEWIARSRWSLRQEIIWNRKGSVTLNAKMFMPCDERIYWLTRADRFTFNDTTTIKSYSSVWDIAPRVEVKVSAPFPVELPHRCISACSKRGGIVIDPYGGSGTTLIAADRLGRRARLVELDPRYCDVIRKRWEQHNG